MRSLIYLSSHRLKNKLFELLHKPGKLILSLVFIAVIVMNLFVDRVLPSASRPISEFYAIIFAFYIVCFIAESVKGFGRGGSIFTLSDVSFLFMSPIKPTAVLFHGMLGKLGTSVWMGLAFVYQFLLLRSFYPVGVYDMLIAVVGYAAVVFLSQLTGMLLYFFTCTDEARVSYGKKAFYLVILLFVVIFVSGCDFSRLSFGTVAASVTRPVMYLFPVAGWVFAFVRGVLEGRVLVLASGLALCLIFTVVTFVILSRSKHGYYEDVLVTAEKNAELSAQERIAVRKKVNSNIRGGIGKGRGVSVFYRKHQLENRRAGTRLFTPMSLYYLLLIGIYGFVFANDVITLFIFSCMISVHTVLSGRWLRELTMPWIYMVPGSPSGKLFFILPELLPKILAESIVQCLLIAFICRSGASLTAALIFARISFSFLLTAAALFTSKIMREREKSNIFVLLCMFFGMLFSLPSLIAVFGLVYMGMGTIIAFIALAVINTVISFAVLFMSRNLVRSGA